MRVLIVSDTHKKHENLITIMEKERPFDRMIHLGDAEGYEDYIAELAGCPLDIVAGNNDFFSELPKEKEIEIGGLKALITHGHYYYVSAGLWVCPNITISIPLPLASFLISSRPAET